MKLSIITINKNNAVGLEKTIKSVISQSNKNFEYIVIDGASTDGSVEVIKKSSSGINYWISEPDTGIYNAMNKGIRKAQGEYCLFLNSGDYLISPATLQDVFNEINNIPPADIFYSNMITTNGAVVKYPAPLTINYFLNGTISHQNSLIRRSLFTEHGLYNEELYIASDWEYFLKEYWIYKSKFSHINTNISVFDTNGIGSKYSPDRFNENLTIFRNVFRELSEPIVNSYIYQRTIYYNIVKDYGETKLLKFILKLYRFFISRTNKISSLFKKTNKGQQK
jgi:glycosyltransferase involved in cell wall biosynthesis